MDLEAGQMSDRVEDSAAIFKDVNRPVTLQFEDLVYKVEIGGSKGWLSKTTKKSSEKKVILKGINGIVRPGEMLAMMGPSGSGKTTLLTALGGRLGEGKLTGSITYNGKPFSNKMNRNTGFVTQDDVLYPHLTVIETLVFTALLRLPNSFTAAQKAEHAEAVVKQLGLTRCKNSIIGGPFLRGISGGERKRVSIGQEMLINPSLLFLDEPTSGLDSTTAQRIVSTLSELVTGGRTCLMTIHQPSSRLFYMFHKVLLLSEGNPVYFGEGSAAMDYFSDIGFTPLVAMNPADYLLDLANGVTGDDSQQDPATIKQTLVSAFKSNLSDKLKDELKKSNGDYHESTEDRDVGGWPTTWFQQFTVLLRRGVKERRHQAFSGLKIGQILFVALLSGFLWWQSDDTHLQDKIGLLFFYSGFWGFYPLFQAIFTFPQERMMLAKERTSRMYRLSSYFISRVVGDLPLELALPTAFVLITYFMSGLKPYAVNFLATLFSLLLSVLVAQGLGLALGAMVMDQKSATTLGSVIMLSFLLSGGYYVQHVPPFVAWVQYLSISGYSYKLFLDSQYKYTDTYPCTTDPSGRCLVGEFPAIKHVGLGNALVSVIVMVVMLFGYRAVAYMALTRIGRTNKIG